MDGAEYGVATDSNVSETTKPKYDQLSSRNSIIGNTSESCCSAVDPEWGQFSWLTIQMILLHGLVEEALCLWRAAIGKVPSWLSCTSLIQLFNIAIRNSSRYLVGSNPHVFWVPVKPICKAKNNHELWKEKIRRLHINRQLEILRAIFELSPKNIIENSQTPKNQTTKKKPVIRVWKPSYSSPDKVWFP